MHIAEYINLSEDVLVNSIAQASDVEILNNIQDLMLATAEYWDNGIPRYNELAANDEGMEMEKQLLALLMLEYQTRVFKDEPHRMHLCQAVLEKR